MSEEHETEISPSEDNELVYYTDLKDHYPAAEILRIEENVPKSWSGVRSCCSQDRVDGAARDALNAWVKDQLLDHVNLPVIGYGAKATRARCSNSGGGWGSPRRCRGSFSLPCWIEFRKMQSVQFED